MTRPLEVREIIELRALAVRLASTAQPSEEDTSPSSNAMDEEREPQRSKKRKEREGDGWISKESVRQLLSDDVDAVEQLKLTRVKRQIRAALSESPSRDRVFCTKIDRRASLKRYTIMLWNVETYGESKAEANPYTNVLIRHVLEELDVDLVLFLETQRFPSQVIAGIEHIRRDDLASVKERTKGPGIDPIDRRRFNPQEQAELAEEMALRDDHERLKRLVEELADWGEARYFAFSSGVTGKVKALPPKIGAWLPPGERPDGDDCVRFKRYYSMIGSRREPSWPEYLPDLLRLYDVRLRNDDADPDSTDVADFSPPLSNAEVQVLIDSVRALTFGEPDLEYLVERRQSMVVTDHSQWDRELNRILDYARKAGDEAVIGHFEKIKEQGPGLYGEEERQRITEAAKAIWRHLERTRDRRRALLQNLERSILLTLRMRETCRCGMPMTMAGTI